MRLILGLDPGLAATGWGVIVAEGNRLRHIAHGTVKTSANAPLAVQYTLAAARECWNQPDGAGRAFVSARMIALRKTEDFKEGPRAFVEKRAPVWTGR